MEVCELLPGGGVVMEVCELLPGGGVVMEVLRLGLVSCKMELMKVVGERGVSTEVSPPSRTGMDGSSLMWLSLQVKQERGLAVTDC